MIYFLLNIILWTLALYGLIEIIKTVMYSYTYSSSRIAGSDGIYIIIGAKNQEEKIEGFLRSNLLINSFDKKEKNTDLKNVVIVDLSSEDNTKEIIDKISRENDYIQVLDWEQCKNMIDDIYKTA